jgi:hypothetical protein
MRLRYIFWLLALTAIQSSTWTAWDFFGQMGASVILAMAFSGLTIFIPAPGIQPSWKTLIQSNEKMKLLWSWINPIP